MMAPSLEPRVKVEAKEKVMGIVLDLKHQKQLLSLSVGSKRGRLWFEGWAGGVNVGSPPSSSSSL
jgi:hypothetical protein